MISCKQSTRLISDAKERELQFKERFVLRLHMIICKPCQRFANQLDMLSSFAKSYAQEPESNHDTKHDTKHDPKKNT
ncbi:hypothetical protein TDB9533_04309 [Thalassocella blandensis]|nr:hypothetical protein TDB9533_04309 [Thalassocella blandensis]